jgi:PAS domain S-box-containing protein
MSPRRSPRARPRSAVDTLNADAAPSSSKRAPDRVLLPARTGAQATPCAEDCYRAIFDATDLFIAIIAHDGTLLEANQTALRFGGVEREALVGRPLWTAHWWPADGPTRQRLQAALRDAVRGAAAAFEVEVQGAGEEIATFDFSLRPLPANGGDTLLVLEGRDVTHTRRAQAAMRRNENRLAAIVANAMEAIVAVDADQRILLFNEAAERIFRCKASDVLGTQLDRFIPEGARARHREHFLTFSASGVTNRPLAERGGTLWALRATGEEFPMEASISQAGEGAEKLYTIILDDISERHRVEEALKESEERLRLVVRATNEVIWEWDMATGDLEWSEDARKAFRYSADQMGRSIEWWCEKIHPDEREEVVTGLNALLGGTGDVWSDEYRFLRGDGSYATVLDRGFVRRDERGVPLRAIGAMMDVTERRRSEEAQRFLSQASALLDSSLDPELTLPGVARLLVPVYADMCRIDLLEEDGSSRRAAVAHAVPAKEALLSAGDRLAAGSAVHASPIGHAIKAGESAMISAPPGQELRLGDVGPFREYWERLGARSVLAVPLMAHERVLGALTMGMSESERQYGPMDLMLAEDLARRIGTALENAGLYAKARRAIRARDEVLNVVSHDLRNPLSTIAMSVQLLDGEWRSTNGAHKWLDMIARAAAQMDRMIGDLMDAARIDQGGFTIVPARHEIAALLTEIHESFGPRAAANGVALECLAPSEAATAWIDAGQIQRVLSNLVGNAMKFTPGGGSVVVRAEASGEEVTFMVADTGPGIPAEELPHVFSRYWQAVRGDRRGMGLGLAISRGIIVAHGGRIWVESEPRRGTVFYFTVPTTPRRAGTAPADEPGDVEPT